MLAAPTFQKAKELADVITETAGGAPLRARSGADPKGAPVPDNGTVKTVSANDLAGEGFASSWISGYQAMAAADPAQGAAYLDQGRAALRARKGS